MTFATWIETTFRELLFASRSLARSPGFAATAILTLALSIGATTAVFTLVDSVLLQPLIYPNAETLVVAWEHPRSVGGNKMAPNPRHVDRWRGRAPAFAELTAVRVSPISIAVNPGESPRFLEVATCQHNLLSVLKVKPALGRGFRPDDVLTGNAQVVMLTHNAWQTLFNGDPGVLGKAIYTNDVRREVVGVLPPNFHFPNGNVLKPFDTGQPRAGASDPLIFLPLLFEYEKMDWNGNYGNWIALARLAPGASMNQAVAQANVVQGDLWRQMPPGVGDSAPGAYRVSIEPMREAVVGASRDALWLLLAAVGALLLLACLNLANAQLGRAITQRRDMAVRAAIGASRGRMLWGALGENLLLAGIGGLLGVALAAAGLEAFRRLSPVDVPRLSEVGLNWVVLLFAASVTIAASLISGMLPALRLISADPQLALREGGARTVGTRGSQQARAWLVGAQVFGCTVLLLVTGLFSKSLFHLLTQDKGFDPGNVAVAEVRLMGKDVNDEKKRGEMIDGILRRLNASPAIAPVEYSSAMPFEGESFLGYMGRPDRPGERGPVVNSRWVTPGTLPLLGVPLLAGRHIEETDRRALNAVLSESAAKAVWGQENALGRQVRIWDDNFTIVGIAADTRINSIKTGPARTIYLHAAYKTPRYHYFLTKVRGDSGQFLTTLRNTVSGLGSTLAIGRVKTYEAQLADSLARERFQTALLVSFGAAALLLTMLGIYGVISYSVAARKQEIGVRMALGASRPSIYRLAMSHAAMPVGIGLGTGVLAGLFAGRVIEQFLFGARAVEPLVILAVAAVFLLCAALAGFLPALRAASVDPVRALRAE